MSESAAGDSYVNRIRRPWCSADVRGTEIDIHNIYIYIHRHTASHHEEESGASTVVRTKCFQNILH